MTKPHVGLDVDECRLLTNVCSNACQFGCFNYPGAFYCNCPAGYARSRLPPPANLPLNDPVLTRFWLLTSAAVRVGADVCSGTLSRSSCTLSGHHT